MTGTSMTEQIRATVSRLFAEKRIDLFIGYQAGSLPHRCRPLFVRAGHCEEVPEQALEKLIWNSGCANNLTAFLPALFQKNPEGAGGQRKIGLLVKGCDLRSLAVLIAEKQVKREDITVIGVPCRGITAAGKTGAGEMTNPEEERLEPGCLECRVALPPAPGTGSILDSGAELDFLMTGEARAAAEDAYACLRDQEERGAAERWDYFKQEMSKCLRCNACRQACPLCYCRECFADQLNPRWIGASVEITDTMLFHLTRILHVAGRCVACDACQRACPAGVDLRSFTRKIVKDVDKRFGYLPGCGSREIPPLSTFGEDDQEEFFTDPEA
jgi:formate dehydrogenase subunit beta